MANVNNPENNYRFKFPEPKEFTGKKRNAETWIMKVDEYFRSPGVTLPEGRDRVRYALFRIGEEAEEWANAELRRYKEDNDGHWPSWNEFKDTFKLRWGEANIPAKALQKLKAFKWKSHKHLTIGEILTTLDTLIQESKIKDEDQKKSFLADALSDDHRKFLAFTRHPTYAESLTAILEYEVELDRTSYGGGGSRAPRDPNAMDVDRVKIGSMDSKTNDKDTCNYCGKKGHWAKDCFAKKNKNKSFKKYDKYKKGYKKYKKFKGKKKYIRGVNAESDSDEESSDDSDDEEEAHLSINKVKSTIDNLDQKQRKELWKKIQKDF
jgi:hypothetical protein